MDATRTSQPGPEPTAEESIENSDVIIVGGGPAGSSCAHQLVRSGFQVTVLDRAEFPRHKTCGGWITPQVAQELRIPLEEYGTRFELQPIRNFRTGIVGQSRTIETRFDEDVSFGILRDEFDNYLLRRSGARLVLGQGVDSIESRSDGWLVNGRYHAPLLIGAGGHFCPVARHLNQVRDNPEQTVCAQEAEFPMTADEVENCHIQPETPELYFFPDFRGYAWCFRKHDTLNIGLGGIGYRKLGEKKKEFLAGLRRNGRLEFEVEAPFKGHAYRLQGIGQRELVGDGLLLIGDAAGLAFPQSGEGIRPAVESGLLAARIVADCKRDYRKEMLKRYRDRLLSQLKRSGPSLPSELIPSSLRNGLGRRLMSSRWFTRKVILERWFLHSNVPPREMLSASEVETSVI